MPKLTIKQENKDLPHFITLTIRNWYYLFDRHNRWELLANSLEYLQKQQQLQIFEYVFMLNHIHIMVQAPDLISSISSFKRYTTKTLKENIASTEPRVLELFKYKNTHNFWHTTNKPEIIDQEYFYQQKARYIQNNPVKKQYVSKPEYWYWSSANPFSPIKIDSIYK